MWAAGPFFFEGDCRLLDSESEWCYDTASGAVHVWLDGCTDPASVQLRGKTRSYLLNASRVLVTLKDVTLFGGTVNFAGSDVVLDTADLLFPTFNRRVLGEPGLLAADTVLQMSSARGSFSMTSSHLYR